MAAASPLRSVPPSPERKLVELLDEKQEPFLLDVYLLENGYIKRSMEAEVTTICCPGRKVCRKLASHGFFLRRQREGILRFMFPALLRSKTKRESTQVAESEKASSSAGTDVGDLPSCIKDDRGGTLEWEFMDDPKQHSPVSVLEVRSEGSDSPVHEQSNGGSPWASCSKAQSKRPQKTLQQLLMSERNGKVVSWKPHRWRKQEEELAMTDKLVGEDAAEATKEWNRPQEQMRRIEAEIGEAIFEEVLGDSVLEFRGLLPCTF